MNAKQSFDLLEAFAELGAVDSVTKEILGLPPQFNELTKKRIIPVAADYQRNNFEINIFNICDDECDNGHSHCKDICLTLNTIINLIDGKL